MRTTALAPTKVPTAAPALPALLKLEALQEHLGMSRSNVYRLVRLGKIKTRRIAGRYYVSVADARAFCGEPA